MSEVKALRRRFGLKRLRVQPTNLRLPRLKGGRTMIPYNWKIERSWLRRWLDV